MERAARGWNSVRGSATGRRGTLALGYDAKRSPKRLVLIDGERLAELMIERGVGVRVEQTVQIRALDLNYFDEV